MNILITGSLSHLAINFIKLYYNDFEKLILIDCVSYCSNNKDYLPKSDKIINIYENINNININDILEEHKIDIFLHCAASTHVDRSYIHYNEFIENNIIAVHKILESIIKYKKLKKFIHISTDEIYGGHKNKRFEEISKFNPTNPYASSKASAEMIINSYVYSYKLPIIIIRPNNLFGKYQYKEKVIPKFIYKLLNNKPITIHGDGKQIRDFIYTEEICSAIKFLINKDIIQGTYNIGIENPIDINELAYKIFTIVKKNNMTKLTKDNYKIYIKDRLYNDKRYRLNCNKIKNLGFDPQNNWKKNITDTVNFYCNEFSKTN
jgi:dTDP-glucose 4,6-dehydratase